MVAVKPIFGAVPERRASTLSLARTVPSEKAPEVDALEILKTLFKISLAANLRANDLMKGMDDAKFAEAFDEAIKEFAKISPQILTDQRVVEDMHDLAEDVLLDIETSNSTESSTAEAEYMDMMHANIFWLKSMFQNEIFTALFKAKLLIAPVDSDEGFDPVEQFGAAFEAACIDVIDTRPNAFANPGITGGLESFADRMKAEYHETENARKSEAQRIRAAKNQAPSAKPTKAA